MKRITKIDGTDFIPYSKYKRLEEENKKLKEDVDFFYKSAKQFREENKKLKEKLSEVTMIADDEKQSMEHILELEEENKRLKGEAKKWKQKYDKLKYQIKISDLCDEDL